MKVLNKTVQDILGYFRDAYANQIGRQMNLASEEHVLSSIFAYVLSVFSGVLNKSYNDRFLSTATGEALDRIAEQYNLSRSGVREFKPCFDVSMNTVLKASYAVSKDYAEGQFVFIMNGHTYSNALPMRTNSDGVMTTNCRFVCNENHSDPMTESDIFDYSSSHASDSSWPFSNIEEITSNGLLNVSSPLEDEPFRQYIKDNMFLFKSGLAKSFESCARLIEPQNIPSVHCTRQSESAFVPGYIDLYCKINPDFDYDMSGMYFELIRRSIESMGILTVGQQLRVQKAEPIRTAVPALSIELLTPSTISQSVNDWRTKLLATFSYFGRHHFGVGESFNYTQFMEHFKNPFTEYDSGYNVSLTVFNRIKDLKCEIGNVSGLPSEDIVVPANKYIEKTNANDWVLTIRSVDGL